MTAVTCSSVIERVVVYARGAIVTRRVTWPAQRAGGGEIRVAGITPTAEPGSFRAVMEGGGPEVIGVRARVVVPHEADEPGTLKARSRELELELTRLKGEIGHLRWRRDTLSTVSLTPELTHRSRKVDPAARVEDALAAGALVSAELKTLDERIRQLTQAYEAVKREAQQVEAQGTQAGSAERHGKAPPETEVVIQFATTQGEEAEGSAAGGGKGAAGALFVEYTVHAARWWPAYAARFSRGATWVAWHLDALVAQASGEDWNGVALTLSTADLIEDVRLPELGSMRLGRAQASVKRGYRPPPEGLEALFEGYDRFTESLPGGVVDQLRGGSAPKTPGPPKPQAPPPPPPPPPSAAMMDDGVDAMAAEEETGTFGAMDRAALGGAHPQSLMAPSQAPGAVPIPSRPVPLASMASAGAMPRPAARGRASLPEVDARRMSVGGGGPRGAPPPFGQQEEAGAPAEIEPAEGWLDFEALRLVPGALGSQRGRLVRAARRDRQEAERARERIDGLSSPERALDPRLSRGRFDYLYSTAGSVDVPGSGRPQRVAVAVGEGAVKPRFVTVPREGAEVFREAELQNPFSWALLAGPVDVFMDGALLTQSAISAVGKGGELRVGLGVEDRLRVVRNARVEEQSAGLLGGSLVVEHEVRIELSSSLGRAVTVEVLDRVPVTDDKDLDVKLVGSQPKAEAYKQEEIGHPIRRGLRWSVEVPAAGKTSVSFSYRLTFSAKSEVVGGNRRE
ncbi:DUF4139 domain-containing protein [Chondromyces apiculatus]|nr:DUF4139 domain-containing protein [Chondromyces apiculatus]